MSKFLEKLARLSAGKAQPMGFGAAATRAKSSPMVILARLPAQDKKMATFAAEGGADAVLVTIDNLETEARPLSQISRILAEIPWGASLEAATEPKAQQLVDMGCDFLVFAAVKTPAAIFREERIGKVLEIDPSLSDSLALSIGRLPVDAVLLNADETNEPPLTVQQLMAYERLASLVRKPLLTVLPTQATEGDLEALWGVGVRGVLLDMGREHPQQRLAEVKKAMQTLSPTKRRWREKADAILPSPVGLGEMPSEEPEEEDI